MTTAHTMFILRGRCAEGLSGLGTRLASRLCMTRLSGLLALLIAACSLGTLTGCFKHELVSPYVIYAPYETDHELNVAIAPFRNESGVSIVDELAISDQISYQVEQADGLASIPINRSIIAMESLGLASIETPQEARLLADALGADGIIVGTITAWDPYDPPMLGLSIALYSGQQRFTSTLDGFDPFTLQRTPTDQVATQRDDPMGLRDPGAPLSSISMHVDAKNHIVRSRIQRYAWGRTEKNEPMGWERFTMSMERYTEFCCFVAVEALMDAERRRLAQERAATQSALAR